MAFPAARDSAVDASNAEAAKAWDGAEGAYWAAHAEHFDRAVSAHHNRLLDAAAISAGDRVLDIGCGTGQTTRDAASRAATGSALGIDLSAEMISLARRLALEAGIGNARFEQADAQVYPFEAASFDLAISRTGAMFFGDPEAAFRNIARALRPDGRLTLITWQGPAVNKWFTELTTALAAGRELPVPVAGAPGPFSLAEPDSVRQLLTATGFERVEAKGFAAPMWFGRDADDAYNFVTGLLGWMLEGVGDDQRGRALDALRATITNHQAGNGITFESRALLIQARRTAS
jgi:ubiquinone/menaquinone biosynthesis C-methylase UbiE